MTEKTKVGYVKISQGIVAFAILLVASLSIHTVSAHAFTIGENPSGKFKKDGSPLTIQQKIEDINMQAQSLQNESTDPTFPVECPPEIKCVVLPAAYASNNNDPSDYGNYDTANRPYDMPINSIIIHDTEGSLENVLEAFQSSSFYASAHYVIDADGTVYQMVRNKDIAWHAGNWWYNMHSIGIEHVGHAASGAVDYTPEMYKSSAALVKWLSAKYDIPKDRQHIVGHDAIPPSRPTSVNTMHTDPGVFWNWQKYMTSLGTRPYSDINLSTKFVTVAPIWTHNKQTVTGCDAKGENCIPLEKQSTNFVYLRTQPREDAPLISDPVTGPGSTDITNNAARLFYGQSVALAGINVQREGVWCKVWVNGTEGWFFSAWRSPSAYPSSGKYVISKTGSESAPIYGRPMPNPTDYPPMFTPPVGAALYPEPLLYVLPKDQRYKIIDGPLKAEHYFTWTVNSSASYDHTLFTGIDDYYLIQYGNRSAFVKKTDVEIR